MQSATLERQPLGDLLTQHYDDKPDDYFVGARSDFVAAMPRNPEASILEIGCGSGATASLAMESERCGRYVGVELDQRAADLASKVLSEVRVGNIEAMELDWPTASFDALILSEVLEHLVDPWRVMARLAPLVRPGGQVFASSPNLAHFKIVMELLRGDWNLTDSGVKDRTHLRWFTPRTFKALFEGAGFEVTHLGTHAPLGPKSKLISKLSGGRLDHLLVRQIVVHGRKT